jgi:hypothetical protein
MDDDHILHRRRWRQIWWVSMIMLILALTGFISVILFAEVLGPWRGIPLMFLDLGVLAASLFFLDAASWNL